MNYVLLIIFTALACWWIAKPAFIKSSGLSPVIIRSLFVIKVLAGFALGWISVHLYGSKPADNDYWMINEEGWKEYQLLIHHPKEYLSNLFVSPYSNDSGFFGSIQSYWNDLKNNLVIKLVSLFNIYSRGDYYVNSLFMNCIGFFGHVALYRVFISIYKEKQAAVIVGCFLLPSCLYFSSGLHKDAIVFTALGLFSLSIYQCVSEKITSPRKILVLLFSSIVLLLIRSYVLVLAVPAAIAYFLSERKKWNSILAFIVVYLIATGLFFSINKFVPSINPPAIVVQKQHDFATGVSMSTKTVTQTALPVGVLEPTTMSFAKNSAPALEHSFLRPYLTDRQSKFMMPLSIELLFYQLLIVISIFFSLRSPKHIRPFILFGALLTISIYLNLGFIVDNIGSIVRYRSLYLPFLVTPALCSVYRRRNTI